MYLDVAKKRINFTFFLILVLKSGPRTKRKVRYIIRNHATNVATKFKTLSSCRTFAIEIENTPRFCQLARPRYLPSRHRSCAEKSVNKPVRAALNLQICPCSPSIIAIFLWQKALVLYIFRSALLSSIDWCHKIINKIKSSTIKRCVNVSIN